MLAQAVAAYPAAIGIELMNEPPFWGGMPFEADALYALYNECYNAVRSVSSELAVGVAVRPCSHGTHTCATHMLLCRITGRLLGTRMTHISQRRLESGSALTTPRI